MHENRLSKLRLKIDEHRLDALLVTGIKNIFYLSGFTGSTAALIVTKNDCLILVDPRYSVQARHECSNAQVFDYSGKSTTAAAAELANELDITKLGYEADHLTVSSFRNLRKNVRNYIKLYSTRNMVESLRLIKDEHEISLIRKAAEIADQAYACIIKEIKPGMSEKDVAMVIDFALRKLGADKEAFDTIAAVGPNAACPHASSTDTILKSGQFLKMDFGARYKHYNSDITRTVCLGRASDKQRKVYQTVLDAQLKAIESIAPGKTGKDIDAVAREYIASMGYGANFGHGLGHAIGIDVHDGPGFSNTSDVVLEPGMVLTVEPGIYIEGWGGVRIEDDVIITETGAEVITTSPKQLVCLRF